jgi:prepilin-type N-terminal cleavage/methylation domain-containing protein
MRQNLNHKGFTLIELMIALIVFSIIGVGLTTVFVSGVRFYADEKSQIENQQALTQFSVSLENDVRKSKLATKTINCLNLTQNDNSVISYCFSSIDNSIRRNTSIIAQNIDTFTVNR